MNGTPANYVPRDLSGGVTAVFFGGTDAEMQAAKAWVEQYLTEEAEVACNQMQSGTMFIQDGAWTLMVQQNQYIYIDEDGMHAVSQAAFELLMKKADGV